MLLLNRRLLGGLARQNAFFSQRANRLCRENHRDFLAVNLKSLLLEVWLESSLRAAQRKADIVAKLFAFTGEFTA